MKRHTPGKKELPGVFLVKPLSDVELLGAICELVIRRRATRATITRLKRELKEASRAGLQLSDKAIARRLNTTPEVVRRIARTVPVMRLLKSL